MAEALQQTQRPMRLEFNPDGSLVIFVDPSKFTVMTVNGRQQGSTIELLTRIVIAPYLASETNQMQGPGSPTQMTR